MLDVGCGGGYLPEELTQLYLIMSMEWTPLVLPLPPRMTMQTNQTSDVAYQVARAESLPFAEESFDLVTCCDVLEHVDNLDRTLAEVARVLKPGGIFIYDTINRTFMTWLGVIFVAQEFPPTRFFPAKTHDWRYVHPSGRTEGRTVAAGILNHDVTRNVLSGQPASSFLADREDEMGQAQLPGI